MSAVGGDDARGGRRSVGAWCVGGQPWVGARSDRIVSGKKQKENVHQWGMHTCRGGDSRGRFAALRASYLFCSEWLRPGPLSLPPTACVVAGGRPGDGSAARAVPCH